MRQIPVKTHKILYDPQTGARLLTLKEAAVYLDYHPFSVYRLVSQGVLRPQKVGGRTLLFLQDELDRYRSTNEWAARKAAIAHEPEIAAETTAFAAMTATVTVDLGLGSMFPETERIEDFSWDQIPIIRADLSERYGKTMKDFEITVNSPDGWTWHLHLEPPAFLQRIGARLRAISKRKRSGAEGKPEE